MLSPSMTQAASLKEYTLTQVNMLSLSMTQATPLKGYPSKEDSHEYAIPVYDPGCLLEGQVIRPVQKVLVQDLKVLVLLGGGVEQGSSI